MAIDEVGNRYGRLVVIARAENSKHNRRQWLCKCDCGQECVVIGENLRSGQTRSCGCLRSDACAKIAKRSYDTRRKDETGNRYGRLTVIRAGRSASDGLRWVCKCDCGNYVEVRGLSLRSGNTKSCGCYRRERQALAHGWTE